MDGYSESTNYRYILLMFTAETLAFANSPFFWPCCTLFYEFIVILAPYTIITPKFESS